MPERFRISQINKLIIFKLFYDCLFVLLVFFMLSFIADNILPGIISDHVGLYKILLALMLNIIGIFLLEKNSGVIAPQKMTNKKTISVVLFIVLLLIFNSLLSLNIWLNVFLVFMSILVFFFINKVFSEE
jgi:hypothetical protein